MKVLKFVTLIDGKIYSTYPTPRPLAGQGAKPGLPTWTLGKWKHLPRSRPLHICNYGFHFFPDITRLQIYPTWSTPNAIALAEVRGPIAANSLPIKGEFLNNYKDTKACAYSCRLLAVWRLTPFIFDQYAQVRYALKDPPELALPEYATLTRASL